jgi:cation transport regulator ChaB
MPYDDISALPDPVKARYSPRCQEVFRKAFNNAASSTTGGGAASDEAASKIAHTAAGNCKAAGKAAEIKAEPMSTGQLDRWLAGKMPRRVLVVPFGGPIPSAKSSLGVDVDGEWFDRDTDIYGPFPLLRQTRDRIVDWHHDGDPTGRMKGAQLGHVVLDEEPESDGLWADFWARAGERRLALVRLLEERGARLFGSSEAKAGFVKKTDGHIDVWPLIRHTISTSPQNTLAVVPPLKAVLDHPDLADQPAGALSALLVGLSDLDADLRQTLPRAAGDDAAKAGRELSGANSEEIAAALEAIDAGNKRLRSLLTRVIAKYQKEPQ